MIQQSEGWIHEWLGSIGFGNYASLFDAAGFTSKEILIEGAPTKEDLKDMGIVKIAHRNIIFTKIQELSCKCEPKLQQFESPKNEIEEIADYVINHESLNETKEENKREKRERLINTLNCMGYEDRLAEEALRKSGGDIAKAVDWLELHQRKIESREVYFLYDRSKSIYDTVDTLLSLYATEVEKKVRSFWPNATYKYRSFDSAPNLYSFDTLQQLIGSPRRTSFWAGSAVQQAVRNIFRIIEVSRKNHPNTKCLLFLFTDCDDTPTIPLDVKEFAETLVVDSGFAGFLFQYTRRRIDSEHRRRIASKMCELKLNYIHVKETDGGRVDKVITGTVMDVIQALS